ncbi:MAG TPA: DUF6599 family protein [Pyrinomonadaceae bacterium]|nr:DUF6599 family protein [Pyrinomonadaceae bacterium]
MKHIKFFGVVQIAVLIVMAGMTCRADVLSIEEAGKLLPDRIGTFKATSQIEPVPGQQDTFREISAGKRDYQSSRGERLSVTLFKTASDSGAYAYFNQVDNAPLARPGKKVVNVGARGYAFPTAVLFYKGPVYVEVNAQNLPDYSETLVDFARQLAESLDNGEGEIPPLVKHLPGWQSGNLSSVYSVTLAGLKANLPNQPVFDAISFDGGAEAVSANYGASKLVIVEFNTPQLATDNTARIAVKIQELRNQGQPTPTAYRRVGNYAVFVFDSPTPEAANQLIDQVKYQQVVQWLGENPFSYERATREFTETTLGVFVSVVKASGLALVTCLAVGGLFGTVLFRVRRSQQRAREAYSDSNAMLRLNIDELTPENDPARLLR